MRLTPEQVDEVMALIAKRDSLVDGIAAIAATVLLKLHKAGVEDERKPAEDKEIPRRPADDAD